MDQSESPAANLDRRSRRRWFQFSLRGFLVVLTALAVWLGVIVNRAREQREAVKAIEAMGGIVTYDWEADPYDPFGDDPDNPEEPGGPVWLRRLVGDEYFQEVTMVRFPLVPSESVPKPLECIPYLRRLRGLETVVLWPWFYSRKDSPSELQRALPHCEIRVPKRTRVRKEPSVD
jgi:hypothetical protein